MITQEGLLQFMKEEAYKPLTVNELELAFGIESAEDFKQLIKLLNHLEETGEVIRTRANRYGVTERMNLFKGRIQGNAKGFAFLIPEHPEEPDIYIAERDLHGAMNGDVVLVRLLKTATGPRLEGEVIRVLERAVAQVVGTFQEQSSYGFVVADDKRIPQDIFIPKEGFNGATHGHKVVVRITSYPEGRRNAEGEVVEILGHKNDPGVDILSIIRKYQLPEAFPEEVLKEAEAIADTIPQEELANRRDLRTETIVTIDGADAKDLDDAVSLTQLENGNYLLGVHIADVSYYVQEDSALDKEAFNRGNSVYLVDRVIPMLPHRLSNGICSLNPQVDRLTMSCQMEIDADGEVVGHDIFPSVIRTTERMTYTDVRQIVEREDDALLQRYEPLIPFFDEMKKLALILRGKRMGRGAIDFDFQESKVLVNEEGVPVDIVSRDRSIAEQIIEEFMLVANETVAEHFHWMELPFIYRVHEDPKPEKLQAFAEFITNFGYVLRGKANTIHPRSLQQILDKIKGQPEETIISKILLRSMQQAKYQVESLGHFGLATEYYTHFTSPIRRYSDLIVHRLIREYLIYRNTDDEQQLEWREKLVAVAQQTSQRERQAMEAERETDELKMAEYMVDKVGEEYEGVISGVTSFGIFVELPNTIEGLVHVSYLTDDYYHFHEKQYAMIGERSGKIYRLGDPVTVRVLQVNIEERSIDFEMVGSSFKKRVKPRGVIRAEGKVAVKHKGSEKRNGAARSGTGKGKQNGKESGFKIMVKKSSKKKRKK